MVNPKLSIVIPCYRTNDNFNILIDEIEEVAESSVDEHGYDKTTFARISLPN